MNGKRIDGKVNRLLVGREDQPVTARRTSCIAGVSNGADAENRRAYTGSLEIAAKNRFATTHWSLVLAALDRASPDADQALTRLCERYWYPLYGYLRGRGYNADDAHDLTQAFSAAYWRGSCSGTLIRHAAASVRFSWWR